MLDDRFGFSTHFDQYPNSPWWLASAVMPQIVATGVAWIRDDFNWKLAEPTPGAYTPSGVKPFWLQAHSYGLKCCAIINENTTAYPLTPADPTAMSNFCAWLAVQNLGIDVMEILNEPNNITGFSGVAGIAALVTLTNTVRAAVNAVNPSIPVIGLGEQGGSVIDMLQTNPVIDGVVYHPYDPGNNIPETVYEPPYTNYLNWVATVRATTTLPIWETERNYSSGAEYVAALWNARRWILSLSVGIEHSFLYDFTDTGGQSVMDSYLSPRQSYYVLQRVMKYLAPLTPQGPLSTVTPGASNFDLTDLYAYQFAGPSSNVAVAWLGNHQPDLPPSPGTATISFPAGAVTSAAKVVNMVSGFETPLTTYRNSYSGGILSVFNFPVDDKPRLIVAQ